MGCLPLFSTRVPDFAGPSTGFFMPTLLCFLVRFLVRFHRIENHPTDRDALISKHIRVTSGQIANFLAMNYQQLNLKLQPWKWCLGGITFAPSVWKWHMKLDDDSNPTHGSSHPPFTCNPPETMVARSGNKITYIWSHKKWRCWGYLQQNNNPN